MGRLPRACLRDRGEGEDVSYRSWRDALPLVQALYRRHAAGCCWHVILDDHNIDARFVDDEHTAFVLERGHPDCIALIAPMRAMSRTQRGRLARSDKRDARR